MAFDLELLVRVTSASQTAIDNIFSNIPYVVVFVVVTVVSDHYGQEALVE